MKKFIGHSDFIKIFQIEDPKNFCFPRLEVRNDGVWVVPPADDALLTAVERAILSDHPYKDLTIPALSFPCSLKQLVNFIDYYGMQDALDLEILTEIKKNKKVSPPDPEILEDYFPELSIENLRLRAQRWAETYYRDVPITKIILYAYNSKFAGILAERLNDSVSSKRLNLPKFAIVFEVDDDDQTRDMNIEEEMEYTKKKLRGLVPEMPWDKLLRDIHYNEAASNRSYPQLLQPDFCSIYKNHPSDVPFGEWYFDIKFRNHELQDSVRDEYFEPRVVLYSAFEMESIEEKIAFSSDGFLPDSKLIAASQLEQWQFSKTEWAIKNGFAKDSNLVCMMAYDQSYIPHLPEYWTQFQMDIAGDSCPDPSTFDSRVNIWTALFQRWIGGDVLGVDNSNLPTINCDDFEIINPLECEKKTFMNSNEETISFRFINLDKFRHFLNKWEISLPCRLFPSQCQESLTNPKRIKTFVNSIPEDIESKLKEIVLAARANGYIGDIDLAPILATDSQYDDILAELWKRFDLDSRKQLPDLRSRDNRAIAWFHILTRWTTGTIAGAPASRSMKLLEMKDGEPGYIELDSLKLFLQNWQIPLPTKLYATHPPANKIISRKLSAGQIAIKNAQKIAKTIWEKEKITTTNMYKRPEIKEAYRGQLPAMNTFRRHMKGLNPNPKPGRRKATNVT